MTGLLLVLFFLILAIVLVATAIGLNFLEAQRKKQVKSVLQTIEGKPVEEHESKILIEPPDANSAVQKVLANVGVARGLETTLQQSGLNWSVPQLLFFMGVAALVGGFLGWEFNVLFFSWLTMLVLAGVFALIPYAFVRIKRQRRFTEFEEQFPEALDFLARSMRAGHAFSVSLEMLGSESPDPLGLEFRTLFNEQNLGAPLEVAFANMLRRLPLVDVRFFVSSVMLQKQTGGNLSEILVRLAYIIRERVRLKGQVRAISAHGRLTAIILTIMPVILMILLLFVAPGYLQSMAADSDGKYLILAAIIAQLVGYYFIRRIIRIKI